MWLWVIPEPVLNYYIHRGQVSDQQTEFGNPEEAATFHTCTERSRSIGLMMVLRERQRQRRLDEFEPREAQAARRSRAELAELTNKRTQYFYMLDSLKRSPSSDLQEAILYTK